MLTEEKKDQNLSDSHYVLMIEPEANVDEETELLDHKTYQKTIRQAVRDEKIAPHLKSSWLGVEDNLVALFRNTGQLREFIEVTNTSITTRNLMEGENEAKVLGIHRRRFCIGSSLTLICLGGLAVSGWAISRWADTDYSTDAQESNGYSYMSGGVFGGGFSLLFTLWSSALLCKKTRPSQGLESCLEPGVKAAVTRKYDKQFLYNFFNTAREYSSLQSSKIGTNHERTIGGLISDYTG